MSDSFVLGARWVFPVAGPPLGDGTVTIAPERIVAVDSAGMRTPDVYFGDAAIIPGLVNAHTHLDLRGFEFSSGVGLGEAGSRVRDPRSSNSFSDFTQWLRDVIQTRRSQSPNEVAGIIRSGLAESLRFGVTLLGDISATGVSAVLLSEAPLWSVVFRELIGLPVDRAEQAKAMATTWLRTPIAVAHCRAGLSPHAPYSVRSDVFRDVAALALPNVPIAIHIAESQDESLLLEQHAGPFVEFLRELGVWDPAGLIADHQQLLELFRAHRMLWVHGNYLPPGSVSGRVYCPRTHAAFGHERYPLPECLAAGEVVALGTDSLASNPDLDVLAEACRVYEQFPELPGEDILRMVTLSGAELLGFADVTGSLQPGKSADLTVIPLPTTDVENPHLLLFDCSPSPRTARRTMWRGQWRDPSTEEIGA